MPTKIDAIIKDQLKTDLPDIRPGDTVRVHQKIKEKDKERIQVFEGLIIARKHGKEAGATITVRKVVSGVGVERIIPLHSPAIDKIEVVKRGKPRRAKLYYLRTAKGKRGKLKQEEFAEAIPEQPTEEIPEAETQPSSEVKQNEDKEEAPKTE